MHFEASSHDVPSGFEVTPQVPLPGSHAATWHVSGAAQTTGLVPVQAPAWQVSVCVQALPSLHGVPSAFAGLEHVPVAGLQTPAS